jgi:cytochrome c oxidase assembly protein subunit 11
MSEPTAPRAEPGLSPKWIAVLVLVPLAMLSIGFFALPPMYRLWCKVSGTQLSPNNPQVAAAPGTHTGRFVTVYFEANVADSLPVRFWADEPKQDVEVGVDGRNVYHFHNLSDHVVRFRPVHYVSPINASTQFGMKVCFCFNDQEMQPGETKSYPVVFTFAPALDQRIKTVSVCYTLFEKKVAETTEALDERIRQAVSEKGGVVSPRRGPDPLPAPDAAAAPASPSQPGQSKAAP